MNKAINGLKQIPRAWYNELKNYLLTVGLVKSQSDSSLFILHKFGFTVYILICVDDIIITGNQILGVRHIIDGLSTHFSLKDLGHLSYFLGIEVLPSPDGLVLSQHKYIMDLLDDVGMLSSKGAPTPMTSTTILTTTVNDPPTDSTLYRRVIGKLRYLSFTHPDIAFTVSKLSQYMHNPRQSHWEAVKRLLRYRLPIWNTDFQSSMFSSGCFC